MIVVRARRGLGLLTPWGLCVSVTTPLWWCYTSLPCGGLPCAILGYRVNLYRDDERDLSLPGRVACQGFEGTVPT